LFPPSAEETERVEELLELLRLTRVEKAPVAALPLGILRLVEVGRALASEPSVLLLDEPLSGLDIKASENLLAVFRQIVDQPGRDVSLIMVEHDVAAVLSLSDVVYVLDFGERIAAGSPEAIRSDPAVRAAYLGDADPEQGPPAEPAPGGGGSA
jgi:ABC-type branched-subunit amino acid transport system ATPase component